MIQISDARTIVNLAQPQISPDGKQIVCVVSRPNYAANADESDLLLIDIVSGKQRVLTHLIPEASSGGVSPERSLKDIASPRWSPSGDRIAFLARGPSENSLLQIYVLNLTGQLFKIAEAQNDVDAFAWRPDGSAIAYDTADVPKNKKAIDEHHDAFEVGNDGYLISAAPTPVNLWLAPTNGKPAKRLTSGKGMVFGGDAGTSLSWSPDGRTLAYTWAPSPHLGDTNPAAIMLLDVASGAIRKLTQHPGLENYATFSPDGSKIAYWHPKNGDGLNGTEIYVTSPRGGNGNDVTRRIDRDMSSLAWMPDGKTLLVSAPSETSIGVWLQPLGGEPHRLDLGVVDPYWDNWTDITVGKDGAIAFAGSEPKRPIELYYMRSSSSPPRRLTDFNHHIAALDLGRSETITWTNEGFTEDGVLTYPPNFVRGKKYPLLLRLHGGPNYQSNRTFWDFIQVAAARGYVVFQPNYRGSDNLGSAYEHAIFNDGVRGPSRDIMAGVRAVEKLGIVDTSREAVSGHSYGGYLSAWLTSHDTRWKAAVFYAAEIDPLAQYYLED
ncbi:MAG: prolyl oligopeptidase family serine peptidase, partial [Candidatus Eremiobacteraeota bacterium]|nr:prolyl oligopeptidase family serine peptidase [Candidatus Eremiobacteraeota bacterium]